MKLKSKALLALLATLPFTQPALSMEEGFEKENPRMNLLAHLPVEISQEILDYLPISATTALGMTSKEMRALTEDDQYWRRRGKDKCGPDFLAQGEKIGNDRTWKDIYFHFDNHGKYDKYDAMLKNMDLKQGFCISRNYLKSRQSLMAYREAHAPKVKYYRDKANFFTNISRLPSKSIKEYKENQGHQKKTSN